MLAVYKSRFTLIQDLSRDRPLFKSIRLLTSCSRTTVLVELDNLPGVSMSAEDIAEEIRSSLPGTEEIIIQYLAGYLVDDAGEEEDVLQVARSLLDSLAGDQPDVLQKLMNRLADILEDQLNARIKKAAGPKLMKLDKVMDMSKSAMSNTIALSEGVDLESINKGK